MMEGSSNGRASKAALADKSRFRFKEDELDLSEHIDGVVLGLKSLSVGERDKLPDLVDGDGKPDVDVPKLAAVFAAVVSDPKVSAGEAEEFLADWPAEALDAVIEKFGELTGAKESGKAAATFSGE